MIRESFISAEEQATRPDSEARRRRESRNALLLAIGVLLGGLVLAFGAWQALRQSEMRAFEFRFEEGVERYLHVIRNELRAKESMLRGAAGFFASSDVVTPREWESYVSRLDTEPTVSGIVAMGYSQRVAPALREEFEASMRAGGNPHFAISPPGERAELQSITHIAPGDGTSAHVLGLDLLANPLLGPSIARARDTGEIVLSPGVTLPNERAAQVRAVLMIQPLFIGSMLLDTPQQRAEAFIGFVFLEMRIDVLARTALPQLNAGQQVRIVDSADTGLHELFNSSQSAPPSPGASISESRVLHAPGREWTLSFSDATPLGDVTAGSAVVLASGIATSLLLALLTWHLAAARAKAELLARQIDLDLRQSERGLRHSQALLSAVINGLPSAILLKNATLEIELANRAFCELIGRSAIDVVGRRIGEFIDPSLAQRLEAADVATLDSGEEHVSELSMSGSNGERRCYQVRKARLPGSEPQVLTIYTDITEVRAQSRLNRALIDHLPQRFLILDRESRFLLVNNKFAADAGLTPEEMCGRPDADFLPAELVERYHAQDRLVIESGEAHSFEEAFPGGWLRTTKAPLRDETGAVIGVVGILDDITERREAEDHLRASEMRWQSALEGAGDAVWDWNVVTNKVFFSPRWAEILGYGEAEVGDDLEEWSSRVHPDDLQRVLRDLQTHLDGRVDVYSSEFRLRRKDGKYLWVLDRGKAVERDSDNRPLRVIGHFSDISARREMEVEIRRNRDLLNAINRLQDDFIRDPESHRVFEDMLGWLLSNAKCEFGMVGEALTGVDDARFMRTLAVSKIVVDGETGMSRQENAPHALELRDPATLFGSVLTSDQPVISNDAANDSRAQTLPPDHPVLANFAGLPIRAGKDLIGMVGLANRLGGFDAALIAELEPLLGAFGKLLLARRSEIARRAAEVELARHRDHLREMVDEQTSEARAARDEAERANRVKSEFLANMSHELRTPMHAILSFAKLGETRAAKDGQFKLNEYFDRIRVSGDRLLTLLNDLLDLSKLETGKLVLNLQQHSVGGLVRDAASEFAAMFQAKGVRLSVHDAATIPPVLVDAVRFGQVLRNLLSNAAKFTPPGRGVEIRLNDCEMPLGRRCDDRGRMSQGVEVVVSDEGVGIPGPELEHVFDKFVQSSRTSTGAGGTGLGLAISREIVEAHRGSISAHHNARGGTDFVVRLPLAISNKAIQYSETQE